MPDGRLVDKHTLHCRGSWCHDSELAAYDTHRFDVFRIAFSTGGRIPGGWAKARAASPVWSPSCPFSNAFGPISIAETAVGERIHINWARHLTEAIGEWPPSWDMQGPCANPRHQNVDTEHTVSYLRVVLVSPFTSLLHDMHPSSAWSGCHQPDRADCGSAPFPPTPGCWFCLGGPPVALWYLRRRQCEVRWKYQFGGCSGIRERKVVVCVHYDWARSPSRIVGWLPVGGQGRDRAAGMYMCCDHPMMRFGDCLFRFAGRLCGYKTPCIVMRFCCLA